MMGACLCNGESQYGRSLLLGRCSFRPVCFSSRLQSRFVPRGGTYDTTVAKDVALPSYWAAMPEGLPPGGDEVVGLPNRTATGTDG